MNKYLIIQLACFGDCLYATTIAKQLKYDDPSCHITWAIASKYVSVLDLNPNVDDKWVINIDDGDYYSENLHMVVAEAEKRKLMGRYTNIIISQISNIRWQNFDGTIRGTILSACPYPIAVNVRPVIRLSKSEIIKVKSYVHSWELSVYQHVILFECSPSSGQSSIRSSQALKIAEKIVENRNDVCIILTSPETIVSNSAHVKDASCLSFRENAELANYCTAFIGCSSGITWLCTSDWVSKQLPMIQILKKDCMIYAGLVYDYRRWALDTSHVIELLDPSEEQVTSSALCLLDNGAEICKQRYHQCLRPTINHYRNAIYNLRPKTLVSIIRLTWRYKRANPHISCYSIFFLGLKESFYASSIFRKALKAIELLKNNRLQFWKLCFSSSRVSTRK